MSHTKVLQTSTILSDAEYCFPVKNGASVLASSDYHDEVTYEDIERLQAHIEREFGVPDDLVPVGEPAW